MIQAKPIRRSKHNPWPVYAVLVFVGAAIYCFELTHSNLSDRVEVLLTLWLLVTAFLFWTIRESNYIRLLLMSMAAFAAIRLIVWRLLYSLDLSSPLNALFSLALFWAELYGAFVFLLVSIQNLSLTRDDVSLETPDPAYQPTVDVFVCTYNEPLDIVRRTVAGAMHIDYSNKRVHLLDDGRRDEMLKLAMDLGCNYVTRADNKFAKAGNINNALQQAKGELVLFLDADHIPCTTILSKCVPHFQDPMVGIVQTSHRFMNSSPIQRNLRMEKILPGEQEMFFQLSMVGKNHWNAAFFAGTAGMIRRSILNELGGMSRETVIEDCEFSVKMHGRRYKSIYLPDPQSIALSPETLAAYFIQQNRWSRGQTQMLVLPSTSPFFCKGLTFSQRVCYLSDNIHYLFGIPRLIMIIIPAIFLTFGISALRVSFARYVLFAAPYLAIYTLSQNYIFQNFRHSFWSDIYETVLAPYVARWTTTTMINPRGPKFHVTPKGIQHDHLSLDVRLVWPHVLFFFFCLAALILGFIKLALVRDPYGVLINLVWDSYNIIALTCAIFSALERPQVRRGYRVGRRLPVTIRPIGLETGIGAVTEDVSEFGARIKIPQAIEEFVAGERLFITFEPTEGDLIDVKALVVRAIKKDSDLILELEFKDQDKDIKKLSQLIALFYCSSETWAVWTEPEDSIWQSFRNLVMAPVRVIRQAKVAGEFAQMSIFVPKKILDKLLKTNRVPERIKPYLVEIAEDELAQIADRKVPSDK